MWVFKPGIWRGSELVELPRPVLSLRLQDSWDYERFKTPVSDGDRLAGHSRNGVDVQIEGQIGTVAGARHLDESGMLQALSDFRDALHVANGDDLYALILYHDEDTGQYRLLQDCTTVRLESDLSDKSLFSYSLLVHASNPTLMIAPAS